MSLKTAAVTTIVTSSTNTAGSTTRGTIDCRELDGGIITMKVTNGATGPTVACSVRVLIAHNTGATPTAASAGSDWKTVLDRVASAANSAVTEYSWLFGPEVNHAEVEFTGNTAQSVTVESFASTFSYD